MRGKVGYIYNWTSLVLHDVLLGEKIASAEFTLIGHFKYNYLKDLLIHYRQKEQRRWEFAGNMEPDMVPLSVKPSKEWKSLSILNTHVNSVERFVVDI